MAYGVGITDPSLAFTSGLMSGYDFVDRIFARKEALRLQKKQEARADETFRLAKEDRLRGIQQQQQARLATGIFNRMNELGDIHSLSDQELSQWHDKFRAVGMSADGRTRDEKLNDLVTNASQIVSNFGAMSQALQEKQKAESAIAILDKAQADRQQGLGLTSVYQPEGDPNAHRDYLGRIRNPDGSVQRNTGLLLETGVTGGKAPPSGGGAGSRPTQPLVTPTPEPAPALAPAPAKSVDTAPASELPLLPPGTGGAIYDVGAATRRAGRELADKSLSYAGSSQSILGLGLKSSLSGIGATVGETMETVGNRLATVGRWVGGDKERLGAAAETDAIASKTLDQAKQMVAKAAELGDPVRQRIAAATLASAQRNKDVALAQYQLLRPSAAQPAPARAGTPDALAQAKLSGAKAIDAIEKSPTKDNPNPTKDRVATQIVTRNSEARSQQRRRGAPVLSSKEVDALSWLHARGKVSHAEYLNYMETGSFAGSPFKVIAGGGELFVFNGNHPELGPVYRSHLIQEKLAAQARLSKSSMMGLMNYLVSNPVSNAEHNMAYLDKAFKDAFSSPSDAQKYKAEFLSELNSGHLDPYIPGFAKAFGRDNLLGMYPAGMWAEMVNAGISSATHNNKGVMSWFRAANTPAAYLRQRYDYVPEPDTAQATKQQIMDDPRFSALLKQSNGLASDEALGAYLQNMDGAELTNTVLALSELPDDEGDQ